MFRARIATRLLFAALGVAIGLAGVGCHSGQTYVEPIPDLQLPKELNKVSLPTYTVESPDILLIDAIRVIPLPPYRVQPLDVLFLNSPNALERDPIQGLYPVEPDGTVNLGVSYGGTFKVVDLTTPEIEKRMTVHLQKTIKDITVSVSLAQSRGGQQISGQHLVRPDGTVGMGIYGSVYVAGMSLNQAKAAIEQHLSRYLFKPEISIDVFAFNSKWYYVITDFAGSGEQVALIALHRERDGARCHRPDRRPVGGVVEENLGRTPRTCRNAGSDSARRLEGHHSPRPDANQLSGSPRRPRVRDVATADQVRHLLRTSVSTRRASLRVHTPRCLDHPDGERPELRRRRGSRTII